MHTSGLVGWWLVRAYADLLTRDRKKKTADLEAFDHLIFCIFYIESTHKTNRVGRWFMVVRVKLLVRQGLVSVSRGKSLLLTVHTSRSVLSSTY